MKLNIMMYYFSVEFVIVFQLTIFRGRERKGFIPLIPRGIRSYETHVLHCDWLQAPIILKQHHRH